ncbi:Translation initiation factor 4F, helicase subunit [Pseudoloma neurophilia]|uniref:RNA helicase n=1 Tax=Pseudoloma neurophilia TaxID=146866 RepID=A0A0R0M2M6_9MICR|nr:Translation initiation factor 4F, helicase subunit [Pseudoloma neurophilia]
MAVPIIDETEEQTQVFEKWEDMNLNEKLLKGIYGIGFETPSFIQKTAIGPIIAGRDIRAQAQSGTGKTGAFAIASLQKIDQSLEKTQVLILCSTREIAEQNANTTSTIGREMGITVPLLAGGYNVGKTQAALRQNPPIVSGTPGRVLHMIGTKDLKTEDISLLIIDEADEMLKRGFKDQVKEIFLSLNREKIQVCMFSATWDKEEMEVASDIMNNPVIIHLRHDEQTLKGIDQYFVNIGKQPNKGEDIRKIEVLLDLFSKSEVGQSVIFVNSRQKAKYLYDILKSNNFPCEVIHSDLTQNERSDVLARVRNGECRCLIATGLMARGIDIQQLSIVFNFDLPRSADKSTYIHRIGRAGRYGRKGKAINIVFEEEMANIKEIESFYATVISPLPGSFDLK